MQKQDNQPNFKLIVVLVLAIMVASIVAVRNMIANANRNDSNFASTLSDSLSREGANLSKYGNDTQKSAKFYQLYQDMALKGYAFQAECRDGDTIIWFSPEAALPMVKMEDFFNTSNTRGAEAMVSALPSLHGGMWEQEIVEEKGCEITSWRGFYPQEYRTIYNSQH